MTTFNEPSSRRAEVPRNQETPAGSTALDRRLPAPEGLIRAPQPWTADEPDLVVGHQGAFFGRERIHPSLLNHVLVTGGTGCGKSQSVVMPLMASMLAYRNANGDHASMLIIDPKHELEAVVVSHLKHQGQSHRLLKLGSCPPIRFFGSGCNLTPSERVAKLLSLLPDYEERGPWKQLACRLMRDAVASEHVVRESGQGGLMNLLLANLPLSGVDAPVDGFWPALRALMDHARSSREYLNNVLALLKAVEDLIGKKLPLTSFLSGYSATGDLIEQLNYVCMSADPQLRALASEDMATVVDVDPYPGSARQTTDLATTLDEGRVLLFQPTPRETDAVAATVLKASVYGRAFARRDLQRPLFIVLDEAQRFVSSDPEHGEEVFLDACRAYRVNVVMATQSIASLRYAIGTGPRGDAALDILCTNTPTKFVMRSTDPRTQQMLEALLPHADYPGERHVAVERPPSGLKPGEAYWMWADGSWGRSRARLADLYVRPAAQAGVDIEHPEVV